MSKIMFILRRPEEGFEEISDVVSFLNLDVVHRVFRFYFGWTKGQRFSIYEFRMDDEPDQPFYVVLDESEEEEGDES